MIAMTNFNLAQLAWVQGENARTRLLLQENTTLAKNSGSKWHLTICYNKLAAIALQEEDFAAAQALLERSLQAHTDWEEEEITTETLRKLGHIAQMSGDEAAARRLYRRGLLIAERIAYKDGPIVAHVYVGLVVAELARQNHELAVTLLSAANMTLTATAYRLELEPDERMLYERYLARSRGTLPPQAWEQAWRRGQELTPDQALDFALAVSAGDKVL